MDSNLRLRLFQKVIKVTSYIVHFVYERHEPLAVIFLHLPLAIIMDPF